MKHKKPRLLPVHRNIKRLRTERDLTQEEFGNRIGAHKTVVSHWERGASSPRSSMLPVVAAELGVSVDELLADA